MPANIMRPVSIPLLSSYSGQATTGRLYHAGPKAAILSNMNTNNQNEWAPLLTPLVSKGLSVLAYDYIDPHSDQWRVLADVLTFARQCGMQSVALLGASRGGITSMQLMARSKAIADIAGVACVSTPIAHEGSVFFSGDELGAIRIPKLLINTVLDECAEGTRQMYDLLPPPKDLVFYAGGAHGTEIFATEPKLFTARLLDFVVSVLG